MSQPYCILSKAMYNPQIKGVQYKQSSDTATASEKCVGDDDANERPLTAMQTDAFGIALPVSQEGLMACRKTSGGGVNRRTGIADFRP